MFKKNNTTTVIVPFQGKRKTINLLIHDIPDDHEIIIALQEQQEEWAIELAKATYDEQRNNRRQERSEYRANVKQDVNDFFGYTSDSEASLIKNDFINHLKESLTSNQYEIVYRHLFLGETYTAISLDKGTSDTAVRKAYQRALPKVKTIFEGFGWSLDEVRKYSGWASGKKYRGSKKQR